MTSILVIGAGIGGIATAARLGRCGYQVTVVEKNDQPGGRCGRLVKDGYHFDTGSTLYLMPISTPKRTPTWVSVWKII